MGKETRECVRTRDKGGYQAQGDKRYWTHTNEAKEEQLTDGIGHGDEK